METPATYTINGFISALEADPETLRVGTQVRLIPVHPDPTIERLSPLHLHGVVVEVRETGFGIIVIHKDHRQPVYFVVGWGSDLAGSQFRVEVAMNP